MDTSHPSPLESLLELILLVKDALIRGPSLGFTLALVSIRSGLSRKWQGQLLLQAQADVQESNLWLPI